MPTNASHAQHSDMWLRLTQTIHTIELELDRSVSQNHGIGLTEFRALLQLAAAKNRELRMSDLAGKLSLNQSSVTRLVERLERTGLTIRDTCPEDKRGVYTVLTDKGLKLCREAEKSYNENLETALRDHADGLRILTR